MKHIVLLTVSLVFIVGMPFTGVAAEVNVNISVPPPPPLEFAAPPDVVVVPSGTAEVYLVPNTAGLYFYGGNWYRFHGSHWFRASVYNGPWVAIGEAVVPQAVVVIPPDYILGVPPGYHRIHYDDFHRHWKDWGHNRHWHNQPWFRDHSKHHWAGKEFHQPPGHHGRDVHGKPDVHHGKDTHAKPDVHREKDVHHGGDVHKPSHGGHEKEERDHR